MRNYIKIICAASLVSLLSACATAPNHYGSIKTYKDAAISYMDKSGNIDFKSMLKTPSYDSDNRAAVANVLEVQKNTTWDRFQLAQRDDNPDPFLAYQTVLGPNFTKQNNPQLAEALDYAFQKHIAWIIKAKNIYNEKRPFAVSDKITLCDKKKPAGSSFPSGHAAWGALNSMIISDFYKDKKDEILKRGQEYGESRVICGVHFQDDVDQGTKMGKYEYDFLQKDAKYLAIINKVVK